jgi:predicted nucleotidyltransferase
MLELDRRTGASHGWDARRPARKVRTETVPRSVHAAQRYRKRYVPILKDMNLSDPTRAVTPTLDGPVLAVLASAGRPLTVGEVAQQTARGSEIGIRRTLARLVAQGLVRATLMGRNQVHELNRNHVAAGVADILAELRLELWRRLRWELADWDPAPVYASVFGSAARGEGDESSDIDLLLVHPAFPGEASLKHKTEPVLPDVVTAAVTLTPTNPHRWEQQVDRLRGLVKGWTGNELQVVDLSVYECWQPGETHQALLAEVKRDGIEVARSDKLPPISLGGKSVG